VNVVFRNIPAGRDVGVFSRTEIEEAQEVGDSLPGLWRVDQVQIGGKMLSVKSQKLIRYCQANPCLNNVAIARKFGVSRERVRVIRRDAGIKTKSLKYGAKSRCQKCGKKRTSTDYGLCRECYRASKLITLVCECGCKQAFQRRASLVLYFIRKGQQNFYLNKSHMSHWLGIHKGFKAHPENRLYPSK